MEYKAKIFKSDRQNFMINMESLSFYVEKTLCAAGINFTQDFEDKECDIAVFRDNMPLIKVSSVKKILTAHEKSKRNVTAGPGDEFYILKHEIFNEILNSLNDKDSFAEFSACLKAKYKPVNVYFGLSKKERLIVDSCEKLDKAARIIRKRINKKHMKAGVIFTDSKAAYIGPKVVIDIDSIILPGTCLEGETVIGRGCVIGPNTRLVNMKIGDETTVANSIAFNSEVGNETQIGPFAYIRPHCQIGNHVKIGDFVEIKNANIGNNSKASHLTYIGDADLGERINMGCGTITANYDGKRKSRTVIEDDAFIGSNSNLIAPVTVRRGAFVAAGSTITDEVPEESLAVARARQVNKIKWKRK